MFRLNLGAALAAALTLALMPGCSSSTRAYTPNAATAREAIDAALAAWQKGGKADQLATGAAAVHFVDHQWDSGQTLEGYQILEENLPGAETEKRYAVTLKLKKPVGEKRVEYIAVGRSPMWIFRDEDYEKQVSMGEEPKPKTNRPVRGR
jgi:hypothetical protein